MSIRKILYCLVPVALIGFTAYLFFLPDGYINNFFNVDTRPRYASVESTPKSEWAVEQGNQGSELPIKDLELLEDEKPPAHLSILVVDLASKMPIRGIEVSCRTSSGSITSISDEDGRAHFHIEGVNTLYNVMSKRSEKYCAAYSYPRRTLSNGDILELNLGVGTGSEISGQVVNFDGKPVGDAKVMLWQSGKRQGECSQQTIADESGNFTFKRVEPRFVISAEAEGLACSKGLRGSLANGEKATGLKIEMAKSIAVHGIIEDELGNRMAGATIKVGNGLRSSGSIDATHVKGVTKFRAEEAETKANQKGEFVFSALPYKKYGTYFSVDHSGYLSYNKFHKEISSGIKIYLLKGSSLSGRVTDSSGKALANVRLILSPFQKESQQITNHQGHFKFPLIKKNKYYPLSLSIAHPGYALQVVQPIEEYVGNKKSLEIELQKEHLIRGKVIDKAGNSISGVRVTIEGDRFMYTGQLHNQKSTWEWQCRKNEAHTNGRGEFYFAMLYAGSYHIKVYSKTQPHKFVSEAKKTTGNVAKNSKLIFVLDEEVMKRVQMAGMVVDARSGKEIPKFSASCYRTEKLPKEFTRMMALAPDSNLSVQSDSMYTSFIVSKDFENGQFQLEGAPQGRLHYTVSAPGYKTWSSNTKYHAIGEHKLEAKLLRSVDAKLHFKNSDGSIIPSGSVSLKSVDGIGMSIQSKPNGSSSSSASFQDGQITICDLAAQVWKLSTHINRKTKVHTLDLTNAPEEPITIVVD